MLTYANDLISKTQGRATYSMEFSHYDYVPNELAEKVIAAHKAVHGDTLSKKKPRLGNLSGVQMLKAGGRFLG